jgi:hypothetical protein
LLALAAAAGCRERRRPIQRGDAGPAVVLIDPRAPVQHPAMPLVDEREPDDELASAQPLEPGKGVRGTLAAPRQVGKKSVADVDIYSWVEPAGASDAGFAEARLTLSAIPGVDVTLEALDGDGKRLMVANDNGAGQGEVIANLAVEPGHTYYARVRGVAAPGVALPSPPYQLTVERAAAPPGGEREPNDDAAHATQLAPGEASGLYGRRRDEDWLRLPLDAVPSGSDAILRLELEPVDGVTAQLRVLSGTELMASARCRGEELRMRNVGVRAAADALLALRAADGVNLDARWLLKIGIEPPLDGAEREPNDLPGTANPLALEAAGQASVAGFLWPGDADLFRAGGAAETLVQAELEGVERVDLKLERVDASGRSLVRTDEGGVGKGEWLPPWPLGAAAIYRVSARARDTAFDVPYRLTLTAAPPDGGLEREPNGAAATATPWPAGAPTVRGYLAPRGDEDWFRFVGPAGKARAAVTLAGPSGLVVRLVDVAGAPLGPSEGPTRAAGPIAPGGSYFVTVKAARDTASSSREPYTLTLTFD